MRSAFPSGVPKRQITCPQKTGLRLLNNAMSRRLVYGDELREIHITNESARKLTALSENTSSVIISSEFFIQGTTMIIVGQVMEDFMRFLTVFPNYSSHKNR